MKHFLHIVLVLLAVAACQGPRVIPKDTLTDIYTDMFIADQMVREENIPRARMDTMLLYETVFENVATRLQGEVDALNKIIEHQNWVASRMGAKRPRLDSVLAPFSKESVYVGLARVARDTSRYPAWFRLVAAHEDTLMVPVDSLDALRARDTLSVKVPADSSAKDEEIKPVPEKPAIKPREDLRPRRHSNFEIAVEEEVAEEAEGIQ